MVDFFILKTEKSVAAFASRHKKIQGSDRDFKLQLLLHKGDYLFECHTSAETCMSHCDPAVSAIVADSVRSVQELET